MHDWPADIYIAIKEGETSVIVWKDNNTDVLFYVFAKADKTALIEITESVQKKN